MTTARALGITALLLGAAAAVAGSPFAATEQANVTAVDLAAWIKDGKTDLRVIDLRSNAAFMEGHVPTAERIARESLGAATFRDDETIVIYGGSNADSFEALRQLLGRGIHAVRVLRGGWTTWQDQVLTPAARARRGC